MKKKQLFLYLSLLSLLVLYIIAFLFWYLTSPRITAFAPFLSWGIRTVLALFLLVVTGGLFLIILSSITEKDFLFPHGEKQITLKLLFPINLFLGKLFGISQDKVRESFIAVNNSLVKATRKRINSERLLILLSHCLQNYNCVHKVTTDYRNCQRCGDCILSQIIELGEKYDSSISIATGGTLARKVIVDVKPTAIVAVACERDLTSGIQDVYPIPVYGVLNERPCGPCINTRVDYFKLEQAVKFMLNGGNQI
jgi:hypothetical protein